jgi:hypothetical protein
LKEVTEPLREAHGTPGFRGTPVEKHWVNVIIRLMLSVYLCPKVITLSGFHCITQKLKVRLLRGLVVI